MPEKPQIAAGTSVLYSPDLCHATHRDDNGDPFFVWVYAQGSPAALKDSPVPHKIAKAIRKIDGRYVTQEDHPVTPVRPTRYWPAIITRMWPDGTATILIIDPRSGITHESGGVPRDDQKRPHTWHLPLE